MLVGIILSDIVYGYMKHSNDTCKRCMYISWIKWMHTMKCILIRFITNEKITHLRVSMCYLWRGGWLTCKERQICYNQCLISVQLLNILFMKNWIYSLSLTLCTWSVLCCILLLADFNHMLQCHFIVMGSITCPNNNGTTFLDINNEITSGLIQYKDAALPV